jgi:O-antigen/teichoic acid export membrane protein
VRRLFTRNVFFSAVSNVADLLQFILMILAANLLTPHEFGMFRYAFSMSMVFMAFSDLGLSYLAIRDISRDHAVAPRYVGNILAWKIPLSLAAFALLMAASFLIPHHDLELQLMLAIMGSAMVLRFFSLMVRSFFQAFERFDLESLGVVVEQFLLIGGGSILLLTGHGVVALAWLFLATRIVGFLFTAGLLNRIVPVRLRLEPGFVLRRQLDALPIGIAFGVLMAYVHIDTIILSSMTTHTLVGIFNAAFTIYSGFFVIPNIIGTVSLPRLSDTFQHDRPAFRRHVGQSARAIAMLSLLVAVVGIPAARWIIDLVYHEAYMDAVLPLQILFLALVITSQNWLLRLVLVAMNRQKAFMTIYLVGLAVRAGVNVALIGRFGIVGAAVATLVSEVFLFLVMGLTILAGARRQAPAAGTESGMVSR